MKTLDQPRRSRLQWLLAATGVGIIAIPLISHFRAESPGSADPLGPQSPDAIRLPHTYGSLSADTARRLIDAGWPETAARKVVDLNLDWFAIQAEENEGGFERQLKHLEALGSHPRVFGAIEKHPELAGLLAGVTSPKQVAKSLDVAAGDYVPLVGLFLQHCDDHARISLAKALASQRSTIRMLQDRGIFGAEILFMYPRPPTAPTGVTDWSLEYDRWLGDELTTRRHVPDEELSSFVNLALGQGPEIRFRLAADNEFRRDFRTQIWPRLNRAASGTQQAFESFLGDPRIWDLLRLEASDELLEGTGLIAIDLLYGFPDDDRPAYPADLHRDVIQILLRREPLSVQALLEFRRDPSFIQFLKKPISDDTRAAALAKLFQARPNHHELLVQYNRLSGGALADEVGPPPHGVVTWIPFYYTVYEVPKKWLQGRDATAMDLFQAALDPVMLLVDVATGGAAEVPKQALVMGGRATADDVAQKVGQKVMTTSLEKKATELAARKLGTEVAETLAKRGGGMMTDWTAVALLAETQATIKGAIGRAATIDITNLVQFLHRYGGVSRRTMKDWLGLEARLFMRSDSKVFFAIHNVPRHLLGVQAAEFLVRTSKDLMLGTVVESEPGQDVLRGGVRAALGAKDRAAKTLRSWQQHVSAIWLMQASQPPVVASP
jgi:hypothetical protein